MEQLFQKIFGREEDNYGHRSFVDDIKERYPYFGLTHFYSLKDRKENEEEFQQAVPKAALYFNDHFLLNSILKNESREAEAQSIVVPEAIEENLNTEPEIQEEELREEVNIPEAVFPEKTETPVENSTFLRPNDFAVEQVSSPTNNDPLFEPLHATDYFLSQGIKLSETVLPNDKLGQQLQSFTSWLKTMKKANADKLPPVSPAAEASVQNMAEKSNIETDVVTEAMAEVYAQQGKNDKAIETYEKLSLLDPSKIAYFAAKIELLK